MCKVSVHQEYQKPIKVSDSGKIPSGAAVSMSKEAGSVGTPAPCPAPTDPDQEFALLSRSIDRSRKRHLSEGLLRGDLVLDRLAVQESSASPLLKKSRPSPSTTPTKPGTDGKMAMTMADFREYMDSHTNKNITAIDKRIDSVDGKLGNLTTSVALLDGKVEANTAKLEAHDAIIKANQTTIDQIRREYTAAKGSHFPPLAPSRLALPVLPEAGHDNGARVCSPAELTAFSLARRSIRLWPVKGTGRDELWRNAGIFLGTNLEMEGKIDEKEISSISRAVLASGPGVTDEVVVVFATPAARDLVMGSASKLAGFIDGQGRATAGMRIEVPKHLEADFRCLFRFGQTLRARHGPGTRRHVKFDDTLKSLFLNIKLPTDERWSRVPIEIARRSMKQREATNYEELERRLDVNGTPLMPPRARSTSLGDPPGRAPTPAGSAWTSRRSGSVSSS